MGLFDFDLEKTLYGNPINPVEGFLSPTQQQQYLNQRNMDRFFGGLTGLNESRQVGAGPFQTILNTLLKSRAGGQSTNKTYADALNTQLGLTKGLADLTKTNKEITKLGYENTALGRTEAGQQEAIAQALMNGDLELAQALLIDSKKYAETVAQSKIPLPEKLKSADFFFGQVLENNGIKKGTPIYNRAMMDYANAQDTGEAFKNKIDAIEKLAVKYNLYADIDKDVVSKNTVGSNILKKLSDVPSGIPQNQPVSQQSGQTMTGQGYNIDPLKVNIPQTSIIQKQPEQTMTTQGVSIPPSQTQVQTQTQNVQPATQNVQPATQNVQPATPSQTKTTEPFKYELVYKTKKDDGSIVGGVKPSQEKIQEWANNKYDNTKAAQKVMNNIYDLQEDVDALLSSKGFEEFFGRGGDILGVLSEDAMATKRIFNKIIASNALDNLIKMKLESPNGATPFGQLNYSELQMVKEDITALGSGGDPTLAKNFLEVLTGGLTKDAEETVSFYKQLYGENALKEQGLEFYFKPQPYPDSGMVSGYNLILQLGEKGSAIKPNYYYVPQGDTYGIVLNKKTKKPLLRSDVKKGNF